MITANIMQILTKFIQRNGGGGHCVAFRQPKHEQSSSSHCHIRAIVSIQNEIM